MTIRRRLDRMIRKLFPDHMEVRDKKREDQEILEHIRPNVHLTREQWIEKIKGQYKAKTGFDLNLEHPRRYSEKIQWRKLYDNDPLYSLLVDKYAVREWVKEKIGEEYLIPLIGVWDRAKDIDFDQLPDRFVLKTNNASATNIIVTNKKDIKRKLIVEQLNHWLAYPFWAKYGEFQYRDISPKIIAEKFMRPEGSDDLADYKFYCFDGKPWCCCVDVDRYHGHKQIVYDLNWAPQVWRFRSIEPYPDRIEKPAQFEAMLALVETLCSGFSHVRVDLYLIDQRIYFGEMTFTPGSGYVPVVPDEYEFILGEQWTIDRN